MPLYFAYGANMNASAMMARCPRSRALGRGKLARHRLVITASGYASVVRSANSDVHGVLWDLALSDVPALDRFEGVDRGLYAKMQQPVVVGEGTRRAMIYVAQDASPGRPRPGYMEDIIQSAQTWALPDSYIRNLKGLLAEPAGRPLASPLARAATIRQRDFRG